MAIGIVTEIDHLFEADAKARQQGLSLAERQEPRHQKNRIFVLIPNEWLRPLVLLFFTDPEPQVPHQSLLIFSVNTKPIPQGKNEDNA
jgi:hypothetical protein